MKNIHSGQPFLYREEGLYALPDAMNQDGEKKYYRYEVNINHEKFIIEI